MKITVFKNTCLYNSRYRQWSQELDSMILMGPSEIGIFYESMNAKISSKAFFSVVFPPDT